MMSARLMVCCLVCLAGSTALARSVQPEGPARDPAEGPAAKPALVLPPDPTYPVGGVAVRAMSVEAAAEPSPVLRLTLRLREFEKLSGNAAVDYLRAASIVPSRSDQANRVSDLARVASDPAHHAEIRDLLKVHLDPAWPVLLEAARRDQTQWASPPKRLDYLLPDLARYRHITRLLRLRAAYMIATGRHDDAFETARVMIEMGRRVGQGPTLIDRLVGVAIVASGLETLMELSTTPGAPNLYWALTDLPSPVVDMTEAIRLELGFIDRAVPELREIESGRLSPESALTVWTRISDVYTEALPDADKGSRRQEARLGLGVMNAMLFPEAARWMQSTGKTPEQIAALPVSYVTLRYAIASYRERNDRLLAAASLPPAQARAILDSTVQPASSRANLLAGLSDILQPALGRTISIHQHIARQVAMLRTVELLRLHAASTGSLPATLEEIRVAPIPENPETGRPFDYVLKDGVGIITAIASDTHPPGAPAGEKDTRPPLSEMRVTLRPKH